MQPTIRPLFDTRQFQEALMTWTNNPSDPLIAIILKRNWSEDILDGASFNKALHDGFL
jgi:hypothetical protein